MSAYVNSLRSQQQHELQSHLEERDRAEAHAARDRLVPLQVRLARLLTAIPPAVQAEGLSILALQAQLRPRGRGHSRCHVGELADALRKLGFRRERRRHGDATGFRAVWRKHG